MTKAQQLWNNPEDVFVTDSGLLPFYPSCTAGNSTMLKMLINLCVLIADFIIAYLINKNCFTLLCPKVKSFILYGGTASHLQ